jgi:surface protein
MNPQLIVSKNTTLISQGLGPGEIASFNGVDYEVVDNTLLRDRVRQQVDLTKLCTSLVTDMSGLFSATKLNQPIHYWDVSQVEDMSRMFAQSAFNHPIGNWDVSKVTDMRSMFESSQFNQPIEKWDVSNVSSMCGMFCTSSSFN